MAGGLRKRDYRIVSAAGRRVMNDARTGWARRLGEGAVVLRAGRGVGRD
jgi:hypothetical protein